MKLWAAVRQAICKHDEQNARDEQGRLVRWCTSCGFSRVVLGEDVIKGPKALPDPVPGQPKIKAVPESVTPFERKRA